MTMFLSLLLLLVLQPLPADPVGVWDAEMFYTAEFSGLPKDKWICDGTVVVGRFRKTNRCFALSWYRAGQVQHAATLMVAGDRSYHCRLPMMPGHAYRYFDIELTWDYLIGCYTFRISNSGGSQPYRLRKIGRLPD